MFPNPYFVHPCYLQQGYPYYWMPLPENLKQQACSSSIQFLEPRLEELPMEKQTLSENAPKSDKFIHKQRSSRQAKHYADDEWSPQSKNRKKKINNDWLQKEDRNAISNIIRSYLKYLTTHEAFEEIKKLKLNYNTPVTIQNILQMMEKGNVNHRNYVRFYSISKMIKQDVKKKGQASKIFVMMFRRYAKTSLKIHFLTSSKLKQNSRSRVLSKIREVEAGIINALIQEQSVTPI